jgi:hypothetical protein
VTHSQQPTVRQLGSRGQSQEPSGQQDPHAVVVPRKNGRRTVLRVPEEAELSMSQSVVTTLCVPHIHI